MQGTLSVDLHVVAKCFQRGYSWTQPNLDWVTFLYLCVHEETLGWLL